MHKTVIVALLSAGLNAWAAASAQAPQAASAAAATPATSAATRPQPATCPAGVAPGTRCMTGQDGAGAYYWVAMPADWNGVLVLHAHGGPELGPPKVDRTEEDLKRWAVWTRAGYAWAGSTYRQGGVAVRAAAEDTERLRQIFSAEVAAPKFTLLHGQSWGAGVAARAAEMYTATGNSGKPPYDAVLLTSGVLGGGTRSYDFRLDLRVVWQAVCHNHPKADEAAYPLWQGLPPGTQLSRNELSKRIDDCTGVARPAAQRTPAQQQALNTLTRVLKIPERSLSGHLAWATWHFQDVVYKRLDGRNPWGNEGALYKGSADDDALNKAVARYKADPAAVAAFAEDADPQGRIPVPVLDLHAVDDPVAFVELESTFRATMQLAGTADHLVQAYTDDHEHSYLSDAQYIAAATALRAWATGGAKPTPQGLADGCHKVDAAFDPAHGCRFLPDYQPGQLDTRVTPRKR